MKQYILITLLVTLSGCAGLQSELSEKITPGDSRAKVEDIMGLPTDIRTSGDTMVYVYVRRSQLCGVGIKDDQVTGVLCQENPNYVNPAAAFLQGMGQGLSESNQRRVNCTSYTYGNTTNTNCY